ncbi:alpha/beta-hydrolase [Ascobolus immersus RN42]|uniref:Alpha/beta-hydrolase n=1 Tax=Ascobolus immersus RN42 TaxID=1160509 RepID=A0A3N4IGV8_ASCIM|nr:alpha/beta-hydrolase [Ascobolus immersus RN42]
MAILSALSSSISFFAHKLLIRLLQRTISFVLFIKHTFTPPPPPNLIKSHLHNLPTWLYLPPSLTTNTTDKPTPTPSKPPQTHPLLITIHGGGCILGTPSFDADFCNFLTTTHPIITAAITHRKYPTVPFPTPIFDCLDQIKAIINDSTLPIDRENVFLCGWSSGGSMALGCCKLLRREGVDVKGVVLFYPPLDALSRHRLAPPPPGERLMVFLSRWIQSGYLYGVDPEDTMLVSPGRVGMAKSGLLDEGAPKWVWMGMAEFDILRGEEEEFCTKVEEEGGIVEKVLVKGAHHAFKREDLRGDVRKEVEKAYQSVGEWVDMVATMSKGK